ncbi:hypothetical protein BDV12DRAFT_173128 [Aspergillus spectabilis]
MALVRPKTVVFHISSTGSFALYTGTLLGFKSRCKTTVSLQLRWRNASAPTNATPLSKIALFRYFNFVGAM